MLVPGIAGRWFLQVEEDMPKSARLPDQLICRQIDEAAALLLLTCVTRALSIETMQSPRPAPRRHCPASGPKKACAQITS